MQASTKKAITNVSLRSSAQAIVAVILLDLVQRLPIFHDVDLFLYFPAVVALVVAVQQAVEHKFPKIAYALGNQAPLFLAVLESLRVGLLEEDDEEEPGTLVIAEEELEDDFRDAGAGTD